eukprot:12402319-Karenia_brevis.AAC.1
MPLPGNRWSNVESITDGCVDSRVGCGRVLAHKCRRCNRAFASEKVLDSHCRAEHGYRLDVRAYVHNA